MTRRKKIRLGILAIVLTGACTLFMQWRSAITQNRQVPIGPFRIADNLYYVGSNHVTSFLLTGPEGHVLIDGAYPETAPMILRSIAQLGFDIKDVKLLLNSHAHADHAGGLAALQKASGAEVWASAGDADILEAGGRNDPSMGPLKVLQFFGMGTYPKVHVSRRLQDGERVRLGPITLTANITAGHTPGCTSWSFPVRHGEREWLAVSIGSLTLMPFTRLIGEESYPGIRADYERSFERLRALPADIFLASHADWFDLQRKFTARDTAQDPLAPFIDPEGYRRFIAGEEEEYRALLLEQEADAL